MLQTNPKLQHYAMLNPNPTNPNRSTKKVKTRNGGQCPTWWPPAKYRCRPLFNAAKFGWCPLLDYHAVTLPRRKTRWKLEMCWGATTRQQISATSSAKYTIFWGHVGEALLFNKFFPVVDTCVSCEDMARQSCVMVPRWRFFASCIFREPCAAHFRHAF